MFLFLGIPQEHFFESCHRLLDEFRYPFEMMPLMYVILKNVKDEEQALHLIKEGKTLGAENIDTKLKYGERSI